jgi:hypothetical protein
MMFDVYFRPSVPGFRVEPYDEAPGFNIDENGKPRRERPRFDSADPRSTGSQYPDSSAMTPGPTSGLPGSWVRPQEHMVGLRVGQQRDNVEGPSFGEMRPLLQALTSTPTVNPYPALGAGPFAEVHPESVHPANRILESVFRVADSREIAQAKCHARCVPLSVGRGYGSDAPTQYRRCMRECLAQSGYFDY